jgi:hypothetical protein
MYLTVAKLYFLVHTQYDTGISTVGSASAAVVLASANRPSSPRTFIAQSRITVCLARVNDKANSPLTMP